MRKAQLLIGMLIVTGVFGNAFATDPPPASKPSVPQNVSATDMDREVRITWSDTHKFYFIQRQVDGEKTWADIGNRGDGLTNYVDTDPAIGKKVHYRVGWSAADSVQPADEQWSGNSNDIKHKNP